MLASEQTQGAEEVILLQDGKFEPVVPVHPSVVVTHDDLELVVEENLPNCEDIKPVIDRGFSSSNDSIADLASSEESDCDVNEPSAPAKRARLDAIEATLEQESDQPDCHVNPSETLQGTCLCLVSYKAGLVKHTERSSPPSSFF